MKLKPIILTACLLLLSMTMMAQVWQYVDPRIGSEGVGRTFPGPSMPFGMCKPGPDCTVKPNAGWAPMPEVVTGFSQTHVSGTGGGQKYGNILIQPFIRDERKDYSQKRISEDYSLGYYTTTFENGIQTEITTSERCAFYRIHYPLNGSLLIDATHYLGKNPIPDQREQQQFVGAEIEVVNNHEVRGFSRVRGGWNNGDAYTVYFCLIADKAFKQKSKDIIAFSDTLLNIKIGISYVSTQQAKRNIPECDFDTQLNKVRESWEQLLSHVQIKGSDKDKRMFYTALYHTMLMPVDKSGENPKWTEIPYYDDYYAIWDTYRSSSPLITLIDPKREVDIVNSLLNIYKREGYMPDARSGDCNGRTQGGSNAEVVIADAFVKGLEGIDYDYALEAMLKDAEVDPGADHEKHGRGGLKEYTTLGYIPYGIDRAGTRTIEYAYDDYCIAEVAKGLGRTDIFNHYLKQSANWKNLWRSDYEWDDVKGYIMPRDAEGRWLDSVPWGKSKVFHPTIPYTPITKVAPWYLPWWSTFFYEALSAEYSLSIPHDVLGLIEACGGAEAFRKRLDLFFERKRYNVGNEPSFLTPCLYHWIGRPDLTSDRVRQIISDNYTDQPDGLPGNDDSGAMSSWLAFHMFGLYPNAGQSYYLLHAPLVPEWTLQLSNGKTLHGIIRGEGTHFDKVTLNGKVLNEARLEHVDLIQGGELVFYMSKKTKEAQKKFPAWEQLVPKVGTIYSQGGNKKAEIAFTLNRQHRTWPLAYGWQGDTLLLTCKEATYKIPRSIVENGRNFCWDIPADGAVYETKGTFAIISRQAFRDLKQKGYFVYDGITWRKIDERLRVGVSAGMSDVTIHVCADVDRTEMWVKDDEEMPLVLEMRNNPLGIDWLMDESPSF
ncbi:MAG: GH92 family glycosyl hydrolase [Prevotella sp.]|nr:GH92 family glycosyl hydrolase [Prevotella sp.]MBR5748313.1 GH92 family glycosyl hydrolase [Prevotella sp.]